MVDIYRFRVKGHLNERWSYWLGGFAVDTQDDGTTVLVGPVVDQAALHGVLNQIRDLGLPLLSVRAYDDPSDQAVTGKSQAESKDLSMIPTE